MLCRLFIDPRMGVSERILIMRMAFGGQTDSHDFHYVGLAFDILCDLLGTAGFSKIERAGDFGLFNNTSLIQISGTRISLNVIAYK